MEEKQDRKKYWLKLDKDFLKSPQIKVIKNMPNGKDYIIFYLSLMLESVETVGHLRFTSLVPYNDEMLSAITDTNIDIVRSATKIFCELGMMQIFDDGTIFMTEVPKITGKECESAERVRRYRLKQQEEKDKMLQCNADVTKCNAYIDKEKDKEIRKKNIDKEKEKKKYGEFSNVMLTEEEYKKLEEKNALSQIEKLSSYMASTGKKYKSHYATILNWDRREKQQEEQNKYKGLSYREREYLRGQEILEQWVKEGD